MAKALTIRFIEQYAEEYVNENFSVFDECGENCATAVKDFVENLLNEESEYVDTYPPKSTWCISTDGYCPYCKRCGYRPKSGDMTDYCPSCGSQMFDPLLQQKKKGESPKK